MQSIDILLLLYFRSHWESENLVTTEVDDDDYALFADAAIDYPGELLDYYLSLDKFTRHEVCIGLEIGVGNKSWTNNVCEGLYWLHQWNALLQDLKSDKYFKKELVLGDEAFYGGIERQDGSLILYEYDHRKREYFSKPVGTVNFFEFVNQMQYAIHTIFGNLRYNLIKEIEARGYQKDYLLGLLRYKNRRCTPKSDIELKLAIILKELL